MNAAQNVIAKFGGQSALARLISKRQGTVQYWARRGQIPARWHSPLLQLASQYNIDLSPGDFLDTPGGDTAIIESPPEALWSGELVVRGQEEGDGVSCYVLDDGRRVISRNSATTVLTAGKGGGNLESYLNVQTLKPYMPADLPDRMIEFIMPGVVNKTVLGFQAETFLDICTAYVTAMDVGADLTERQQEIAIKASMFLASCSKVGLIALIDEATGYQYDRAEDALQMKLRLYLEEEMREWEKTFPDELWREFGRLTNWKGSLHKRPKYWGKLVMELVYDYLDKDVANWLRDNAPKPQGRQNYHQWMTSQYGLRKLIEHIWMLVGMASACHSIHELRMKMAEKYGRQPVQLTMFIEPPYRQLPPPGKSSLVSAPK